MSQAESRAYPRELLESIVRIYNLVSQVDSMNLAGMKLLFELPRKGWGEDMRIITWLSEKLAHAFLGIQKKYLPPHISRRYPFFHLEILSTEKAVGLSISGALYIPPSTLLKLLQLFMWYEIRQQTGTKPKYSPQGREQVERMKREIKRFRRKVDGVDFTTKRIETLDHCHFCGAETQMVNVWNYRIYNQLVEIETPVCDKHRMRKI